MDNKKWLMDTFLYVCKLFREHPIDMEWYLEDPQRALILMNGSERDPEGLEWADYFLEQTKNQQMGR